MGKAVSKICNIITVLFTIAVIAVVAALLLPKAFGYQTFAVISGSMEPVYHVGSIVYVDTKAKPEEVEVGDPITFVKTDKLMATHRVVEIHSDPQEFVTKGDANDSIDLSPVPFSDFVGKAMFSIPLLGYISLYVKTKIGIFVIVAVLVVLILLNLIPEILKPEDGEGKETANKKKGK